MVSEEKIEPKKLSSNFSSVIGHFKYIVDELSMISKEDYLSNIEAINSSDFEYCDEQNNSPLHLALTRLINERNEFNIKLFNKVLEKQTSVFVQDSAGMTPLHLLVKYARELINQLSKQNEDQEKNEATILILNSAIEQSVDWINILVAKCDLEARSTFINWKDSNNRSALELISSCSEPDEMTLYCLLLDLGGDIVRDKKGNTLLHDYAQAGQNDLIMELLASLENNQDKKQEFLDARNIQGETALHIAAKAGFFETCTQLLVYGANVNLKDLTENTPLDVAKDKSVKFLLSNKGIKSFMALSKQDSQSDEEEIQEQSQNSCSCNIL